MRPCLCGRPSWADIFQPTDRRYSTSRQSKKTSLSSQAFSSFRDRLSSGNPYLCNRMPKPMHADMQLSEQIAQCCTERLRHVECCAQPRDKMAFSTTAAFRRRRLHRYHRSFCLYCIVTHAARSASNHTFSRHGRDIRSGSQWGWSDISGGSASGEFAETQGLLQRRQRCAQGRLRAKLPARNHVAISSKPRTASTKRRSRR
jgi:hypothetical protein